MDYSVEFINNSQNFGSVCIYQTDPELDFDVMSLAWIAKSSHPSTTIRFSWKMQYQFVWSEIGDLKSGVVFDAFQGWDADIANNNVVTFTNEKGAYTFKKAPNIASGKLHIIEDQCLPLNTTSVGIGIGGSPAFIKQTQPNMHLIFNPRPKLWITFGNYTHGEVLDETIITNKAEIEFPDNIYSIKAILNKNNSWTIIPN